MGTTSCLEQRGGRRDDRELAAVVAGVTEHCKHEQLVSLSVEVVRIRKLLTDDGVVGAGGNVGDSDSDPAVEDGEVRRKGVICGTSNYQSAFDAHETYQTVVTHQYRGDHSWRGRPVRPCS